MLWKRINFLRDKHIPVNKQLEELLKYKKQVDSCTNYPDTTRAFLLQRIGVMYYGKAAYLTAISYTRKAIEILQHPEKKNLTHYRQEVKCYRNLEIYYDSLNQAGKKNEAIDSSISIAINARTVDTILLYSIADKITYLFNVGDYLGCVSYASMSQGLAEEYGYHQTDILKRIFSWKINALLILKNYALVESALQNKIQEYEQSGKYNYIGNLYGLWAKYFLGTGKLDSALRSYERLFHFNLKRGLREGSAFALNSMGFLYFTELKDCPKALFYYFKAIPYADPKESISIFSNIANVYSKKKLYDSAFYYYQEAFNKINPGMDEFALLHVSNNYLTSNLAEYVITLVLDKGDACLDKYRSTKNEPAAKNALLTYKAADLLLNKIKKDQHEIQSKLFWRTNIRRLYEHAIEACWLKQNVQDAFYFFEKSRAVLLNDQLDELLLKANDPRSIPDSGFITLPDVQDIILKDHSGLLEIFHGDSSLYTLIVTAGLTRLTKINIQSYDSLANQYISYISNPALLNSRFKTFVSVSSQLSQLIFQAHLPPKGRIIISPDGLYFPFEALVTRTVGQAPVYLLNDYSVSYTYSARFLLNRPAFNPASPSRNFMGIAPVSYSPYMQLAALKGSDLSLEEIRTHFSQADNLLASAASKSNFLRDFSKYKIIQLYSHASFASNNSEPVIYLSDSLLYLSELVSKSKPATRLVVLSACETGLGKEYKGEGIFSFSRGFAELGIPAAITNLWSVENEATYQLTEFFYEYLSEGLPTDIALQKAKLKYIRQASREKTLPFYWAAPILVGKTEIIVSPKPDHWKILALMAVLTGISLPLILERLKKMKR